MDLEKFVKDTGLSLGRMKGPSPGNKIRNVENVSLKLEMSKIMSSLFIQISFCTERLFFEEKEAQYKRKSRLKAHLKIVEFPVSDLHKFLTSLVVFFPPNIVVSL